MIKYGPDTIKCGARHGWPAIQAPKLHVAVNYAWGLKNENHVIGGLGSRPLFIDCIVGDATIETQKEMETYLNSLELLIGTSKDLQVTHPDTSDQTWTNLYLAQVNRIAQPGQRAPIPLRDTTGIVIGTANKLWIQLVLVFVQVSV